MGLANNERLKKAVIKAVEEYGVGPGAVRSISGTTKLHVELEQRLAKFKKTESTMTVTSGFAANTGVIPALMGKEDVIFSDELNHASIIDGCRLANSRIAKYQHRSIEDLKRAIVEEKKTGFRRAMIISDGVFSMDGDLAPLPELVEIAKNEQYLLMIDDAHGEGVLGDHGRGIVDHFKLPEESVDVEVGTFSKAFGIEGGLAASNEIINKWLRQRCRSFLFSSAMTIPNTAACIAAIDIMEESDDLIKKLWDNGKYFKDKMKQLGFNTGQSETPITPITIGEETMNQEFSRQLFDEGVYVTPIAFPLVPRGTARLRVMISAIHTKEDLDYGIEAFSRVGQKLGLI